MANMFLDCLPQNEQGEKNPVALEQDVGVGEPHAPRRVRSNLPALRDLDKLRTEIDVPALIKRLHIPIQNLEDTPGLQGMQL